MVIAVADEKKRGGDVEIFLIFQKYYLVITLIVLIKIRRNLNYNLDFHVAVPTVILNVLYIIHRTL